MCVKLFGCPSPCSCVSSVCYSLNTPFVTILVSSFLDPLVYRDTLTPSGHIFLMRNILQHYNTKRNKKIEDGIRKIVPQNAQLHLDENGQIIMGNSSSFSSTISLYIFMPVMAFWLYYIFMLQKPQPQMEHQQRQLQMRHLHPWLG